jgi:hypothetical protein
MLSFKELEISKHCNLSEEVEKHMAQAGSVFPLRAKASKEVEITTDNVKAVRGRLGLEVRVLGSIPAPTEEDPTKTIKLSEKAIEQYVDAHPEMIQARKDRAEAIADFDDIRGLVTAYNSKKELLSLMMSDRKSEFYSKPTETSDLNDSGVNIN